MNEPITPLRRVSILACEGVLASTLMQACDLFHMASLRLGIRHGLGSRPAFETRLVSPDGRPARSFSGVQLPVEGALDTADILVLPAFWGDFDALRQRHPQVLDRLRESHRAGSTLCAEASGVFWLAEAGLLDGKEATTYWRFFDEFVRRFPQVQLNRDKHQTDAGRLYCAASSTSACDFYLHLIERFCGLEIAQTVARDVLHEVQRSYTPGRIGFGGQKLHRDMAILQIQHWMEEHYTEKFRLEDIARHHGMSIRNFMRRFQAATGDKPLHYLQRLRIETAKNLLISSRKSIKTISYEVGYDDASFFARLFRQHTGVSPNQYRQQANPRETLS